MVQVRVPDDTGSGLLRFADGSEVIVTAHVTKEGTPQEDGPGSVRQRLEVETEQVASGTQSLVIASGLRINVYQPQLKDVSGPRTSSTRLFRYGERLRFPTKISLPRNYCNPGAFDYRGYLAENGLHQSCERGSPSRLCRQPG